jgi:predicted ATPase/DNA-binding CsgD family transcriptional regulator
MLVGREAERARLDELLARARAGRSSALLVRGEPGIGKSALLAYARERSGGIETLSYRGIESEAELPFSALAALLRPLEAKLAHIPARQTEALAGAIALGPPVPGDRFAAYAATLSLLAVTAEQGPLLVTVDDVHWLDSSSREALFFSARRLGAEGIVVLFAGRSEEMSFDVTGLEVLQLEGLAERASMELLEQAAQRKVSPRVVDRLCFATNGNPLAMLEIGAVLTEEQLAGTSMLPDPLPAAATVESAFGAQVARLERDIQKVLLVAAANDSTNVGDVLVALDALGLQADSLDRAEETGVVSITDGRLEFRHPLLRSTVYRSHSTSERREVHRALALALANSSQPDRRAWHLAAAMAAPSENVARELEKVGSDARARGAPTEAMRAFFRAAELTPRPEKRGQRFLEAAINAYVGGEFDAAVDALVAALALTDAPPARAEIQHLHGRCEMLRGTPMAAYELLVSEAARIEASDPGKAALMLAEATGAACMAAQQTAANEAALKAQELASRVGGIAELVASHFLAYALITNGDAASGRPLLLEAQTLLAKPDLSTFPLIPTQTYLLRVIEEYEAARHLVSHAVVVARGTSAAGALPFMLAAQSDADFHTGRWVQARANAAEAVELAAHMREDNVLAFCLICLGRIDAVQGREDDCRRHITRALQLASQFGAESLFAHAGAALGLLELSIGNPREAIGHLQPVAELLSERGVEDPGIVPWGPDLIESQARIGDTESARATLQNFERQATRTDRKWAFAAAARCKGVLADDDAFEDYFVEALERHQGSPTPFERARTQLCFGERLRRGRRRIDAREQLRAALATFEDLGAVSWADRARTELKASGERARRRQAGGVERLTPQELQVALVVARGATNREAAAELFLSPKTIDFHLGHIYSKLGIRSRTELAHHVTVAADFDLESVT